MWYQQQRWNVCYCCWKFAGGVKNWSTHQCDWSRWRRLFCFLCGSWCCVCTSHECQKHGNSSICPNAIESSSFTNDADQHRRRKWKQSRICISSGTRQSNTTRPNCRWKRRRLSNFKFWWNVDQRWSTRQYMVFQRNGRTCCRTYRRCCGPRSHVWLWWR